MERKFFTEFGLNVFTSYKTLVPLEDLDNIQDGRKYHIYFIAGCPKVTIDSKSIGVDASGINVDIIEYINEKESKISLNSLILAPDLDHSKLEVKSLFPYKKLKIENNDTAFLEKYPGTPPNIEIDSQGLYNIKSDVREFEVLYIGQSYGVDGNRTAQDRLGSHSTLQKILTDCHSKQPDKQLYVLLLEFQPKLHTTFDGISKKYTKSNEEDDKHMEEVLSNLPEYEQVINITEAALINYFKPNYNTNFVENFPDENHKGYRQYYNLDYNGVTVELDLEFDNFPRVQLYSEANRINSAWDFIRYNLYNDNLRKNMYEIFGESQL